MSSSQLQNWKDDLNDGAVNVGNVRSQVIAALDDAWQHVHNKSKRTGVDELDRAAEALQQAIDVLTYTQGRIKETSKVDFEEYLLAAGGTKGANGGWTMPEGWWEAAPPSSVGAATGSLGV